MDKALYIIFSIFDAIAMLALMFKLYRLPIGFYAKKISIMAVAIALVSYILRMKLQLPFIDLPIQYILFVLFFRYIIQMKIHYSAFVTATGLIGSISIQLIIYYFYDMSGVINSEVLSQISGLSVYIVQISTDLFIYALCYCLWKFNFGFAFILLPPHDFMTKEDYSKKLNRELVISTIISALTISATVWFLHSGNAFILIIFALISFAVSYHFSKKGDMEW